MNNMIPSPNVVLHENDAVNAANFERLYAANMAYENPELIFRKTALGNYVKIDVQLQWEWYKAFLIDERSVAEDDIVYRLEKRAEICRQIQTRKSVQEGTPDRIADLLEEATTEIKFLKGVKMDECRINQPNHNFSVGDTVVITKLDTRWWKILLYRIMQKPCSTMRSVTYIIKSATSSTFTFANNN